MRTPLVFPPHASPTYGPLGIASLVAFVAERTPECRVTAVECQPRLVGAGLLANEAGAGLRSFLRGLEGDFCDPDAYRAQQSGGWRRPRRASPGWASR